MNKRQYWTYVFIGLLLILPIDLLSTYIMINKYGYSVEANEYMKYIISQGFSVVILTHFIFIFLSVLIFKLNYELSNILENKNMNIYNIHKKYTLFYFYVSIGCGFLVILNNFIIILGGDSFIFKILQYL